MLSDSFIIHYLYPIISTSMVGLQSLLPKVVRKFDNYVGMASQVVGKPGHYTRRTSQG